jgi:hypothetical protein
MDDDDKADGSPPPGVIESGEQPITMGEGKPKRFSRFGR